MALAGESWIETGVDIIKSICDCSIGVLDLVKNIDILSEGAKVSVVVSTAATTIATLLVVIEMCTQAMGFHFDDINDAVRFVFKVVVYKIIIENSSKIVKLVYGMFMTSSAWTGISDGFNGVSLRFNIVASEIVGEFNKLVTADNSFIGIEPFLVGIILFLTSLVVVVLCINIIASISGLIFELCINVAIAPVPIATLVNSQTRQIGINFIKGFAGNCLTLTMYTICFNVYGQISINVATAFQPLLSSGSKMATVGLVIPEIVGLVLLVVAIKNVGTMINKVLS